MPANFTSNQYLAQIRDFMSALTNQGSGVETVNILAIGQGVILNVPAGTTNGTPITNPFSNTAGIRFYLPTSASVTYGIFYSQPVTPPSPTVTISNSVNGAVFDENLVPGALIYVTSSSGAQYRWI